MVFGDVGVYDEVDGGCEFVVFVGVGCCVGGFEWFVNVWCWMVDDMVLVDGVGGGGVVEFYVGVFVEWRMLVSVCLVSVSLKVLFVCGVVLVKVWLVKVCVFCCSDVLVVLMC